MSDPCICPLCKGSGQYTVHKVPPGVDNVIPASNTCHACYGRGIVWRPVNGVDMRPIIDPLPAAPPIGWWPAITNPPFIVGDDPNAPQTTCVNAPSFLHPDSDWATEYDRQSRPKPIPEGAVLEGNG